MDNTDIEAVGLQERNKYLERKVAELTLLIKYYEEMFRLSQQKRFGASSEKTDPRQMTLFDEADRHKPEPSVEKIAYTRRKRTGKRDVDLSGLPVETAVHELPEEERVCPECGGPLHVMGYSEPRREIVIIPPQVHLLEHVQAVYSCRNCERNGINVPVLKAPRPEPVIKGSVASPSSVAYVMTQKYMNAMPLYRQENDLLLNGFALSRQTMANWMIYVAERWLALLYSRMMEIMLGFGVLHADETALQVLHEPGRKSRSESYMWIYLTGAACRHPIVIYEYQETRSSSHPKRFLSGPADSVALTMGVGSTIVCSSRLEFGTI